MSDTPYETHRIPRNWNLRSRCQLLVFLIALFAISGCGGQTDDDASATGTGATEGSVTEAPLEATDDPASNNAEGTSVERATTTPFNAEEELAPQGTVVTVQEIVGGDTIRISPTVEGKSEVKLIGIDAPQTGGQPFGDAARAQATSLIGGREVALEFDKKRTDNSGKLLAYVRLPGGNLFNEYMLRAGYAQTDISVPNTKYEEELRGAQRAAREEKMGIWELPPQQLCKLTNHGNGIGGGCKNLSNAPDDGSSSNESRQQNKPPVAGVPPVPPDGDYDCGHFNNQQQAQKVLDNDTSDPYSLDGEDQNGVACENFGG